MSLSAQTTDLFNRLFNKHKINIYELKDIFMQLVNSDRAIVLDHLTRFLYQEELFKMTLEMQNKQALIVSSKGSNIVIEGHIDNVEANIKIGKLRRENPYKIDFKKEFGRYLTEEEENELIKKGKQIESDYINKPFDLNKFIQEMEC